MKWLAAMFLSLRAWVLQVIEIGAASAIYVYMYMEVKFDHTELAVWSLLSGLGGQTQPCETARSVTLGERLQNGFLRQLNRLQFRRT